MQIFTLWWNSSVSVLMFAKKHYIHTPSESIATINGEKKEENEAADRKTAHT